MAAAPATAQRVDNAVQALVRAGLDRATVWLTEHRSLLDEATTLLLQKETLGEQELLSLSTHPTAMPRA